MNPFIPDWVPWWAQFVVLILAIFFGICLLFMPFAVFGLKGRLNYLNQQMEDIQAQLRVLLKRTAEAREPLTPKIQSLSHTKSKRGAYENGPLKDVERKMTGADPYLYPFARARKQTQHIDQGQYIQKEFDQEQQPIEREDTSSSKFQEIHIRNKNDQVYDPPSFAEEKKEIISTRKKEPILRWPPK